MNKLSFRKRPRYRNSVLPGGLGKSATVVAGLVVVLVVLRIVAPSALSAMVQPLERFGIALGNRVAGTASLESKQSLRDERDRLQAENVALTERVAASSAQITDLTALLGSRTEPEKGIVASVVARPPVAPYDVLIIDQGTDAGVVLGSRAYGPGGTPIGSVGAVTKRESRVALYSTRSLTTNGWAGQSRIPITLTGQGAGAFTAEVPRDAGIAIGDGVYVAGNGVTPIGTVVTIESDPSSPTVRLDVRPYTNPFSITWVTVARQ